MQITLLETADVFEQEAEEKIEGTNLADAEVSNLPGDIAGLHETLTGKITVDEELLHSQPGDLGHVLTHEANHKRNKVVSKEGLLIDNEFEEGLTEALTSEDTGTEIAYPEEIRKVEEVARTVRKSRLELTELFRTGQNKELNEIYIEAELKMAT